MSLNPDIAAFLELVGAGRDSGKRTAMHQLTPQAAREQFDQSSQLMMADCEELPRVETLSIAVRDGNRLEARLYSATPPGSTRAALLYFHGGGYVVGSLDSHDALCRSLAARAGCVVISVGYRLAPEWVFPTAVHDAQDAWHWLVQEAGALGIDPARLAVAGDSVGASLATVLCNQLAADGRQVQPCLQVLIYPVTDASRPTASLERYGSGYLLEKDTLSWFYQHYAGEHSDRLDPRFSPLLAQVAPNVAPVLLAVAECDPLHDEGVAYGAHLKQAGVAVDVKVYAGMTHDFMRMGAIIDEAEEALEWIAESLRVAFARH
ncbi:carboxylesterase Est2 [Pseudomonas sp. FH4]|jgi:acetyl esterase|uniref:Acetyl esterase n=1 Tax=Pseudomonas brenneri TaxID=129817 RepID=A0A5B2UXV0_9PSED|nr:MULTISPECIES: alpha/beta hydrolase [Pseudomonas]KAA6174462.1 alpha/beta hydrolase [Pseudomonas marginalis]ETK20707.1 carboxylesterase Est2 [Pseudomonas sp. FH4]KAA2230697.1 alpha/beta hydrolase [Pseudomonas brenneri]MBF8007000.1 alpha/beta hydrolase [Pseudomonas brenneri]TWR77572.1 alpha/beta hydrolase [Pseudomonas brenneri]